MTEAEYDQQRLEFEAFTKACHAKGQCEFSGLNILECVKSICDCFETEGGAQKIIDNATEPVVDTVFDKPPANM